MKKITIVLGVAVLMASCGGNDDMKLDENGEYVEKSQLDKVKDQAKNIEENGAYSAVSFNDGLLAEITLLDVKYQELSDMDALDTTVSAIENSAKNSIKEAEEVIAKINKLEGVGIGADRLKQAGLDLAQAFKVYAEGYLKIADVFAVPDAKWSDDQYDRYVDFDDKCIKDYFDAGDSFNSEQQSFFSMNNLTTGEIIDPNAIYQDQKTK